MRTYSLNKDYEKALLEVEALKDLTTIDITTKEEEGKKLIELAYNYTDAYRQSLPIMMQNLVEKITYVYENDILTSSTSLFSNSIKGVERFLYSENETKIVAERVLSNGNRSVVNKTIEQRTDNIKIVSTYLYSEGKVYSEFRKIYIYKDNEQTELLYDLTLDKTNTSASQEEIITVTQTEKNTSNVLTGKINISEIF